MLRSWPAYLALSPKEWQRRIEQAHAMLADCRACPRDCGVNRLEDRYAACKTGRYALVSSYFPHFGEEDCLRGWNGSGTIFFAHCNLRCVFCLPPATRIATTEGQRKLAGLSRQTAPTSNIHVRNFVRPVQVLSGRGRWVPVLRLFQHAYRGDLLCIKPFNTPPIWLTPDHQVPVIPKQAPNCRLKVPACMLTRDYYLIIPKRRPREEDVKLDVPDLLRQALPQPVFRKSKRTPVAQLQALFQEGLTSYEIARRTGYHPAYIRTLRRRWRRGQLHDNGLAANDVVTENGWARLKTERRPGIPQQLFLDEPLAWLLGLYCAKGHVTRLPHRPFARRLVFSFAPRELERAQHVRRLLQERFGVHVSFHRRRTNLTVAVGKTSLALLFQVLCGTNARDKQVPPALFRARSTVLQAFLEGYLAGHGRDRGSHYVITTISRKLAYGLFEVGLLLDRLPSFHQRTPASHRKTEGRTVRQSTLYYVKFPKNRPETDRPRHRWKETPEAYLVPLQRITHHPYEGPVYNLEVADTDHTYAAPFIAVGNCQNYDISQAIKPHKAPPGHPPEAIAAMMLELQELGCHNINLVTPEHVVPQIIEALAIAVERGLRLPIVYNTSAYDSLESLRLLEGIVDIYMPDFKFWSSEHSQRYMKAADYPEHARAAIKEMHRQVGDLELDDEGLARRGLLIRHLVMPGCLDETRAILEWIVRELGPNTYVNLMDQYYPAGRVNSATFPELNRRLSTEEFAEALHIAAELGLHRLDRRRPHPRLLMKGPWFY
ncbi:MAG: hypothetical protein Q9M35_00090 [Rhodothermus sp.]|nr:hypothetical protein [Rhodothermus sp.]